MTNRCNQCGSFLSGDTYGTCDDCGPSLQAETVEPEPEESLDSFGVDSEPRTERESVRDHGIDSFGADTREQRESKETEQANLSLGLDDGQQTLEGDKASNLAHFED